MVSIIVPVRNGEATISSCVESILALDFPAQERELIVVDNGSSDRTASILAGFGDRVRVVREETRGPAAARNAGIRAARGEFIAFTDADCQVDAQWLSHLLLPIREDPTIGIVGGRVAALPPGNRITSFGETIHDQRRAIEVFKPPYVLTANWCSRRTVLLEAGLFDETLLRGSDSALAIRIGGSYRLVYRHDATVFHPHESTVLGLFREGRDHGRGRAMMRAAGVLRTSAWADRLGLLKRVTASGLRVLAGPQRFHALCQMVFDFGKALGGIAELVPLTRWRRVPEQ
jgi:glycosyltransferase involved in cell wall biosynthesis